MNFNMFFPVRIVSGEHCIKNNPGMLCIGSHAFIVTGRQGAKASGALDDVISVLTDGGVAYTVFDKSAENPPAELCHTAGRECAASGADFVIGIGGGSAIDAAKATAVFAADSTLQPLDIYDTAKRVTQPLPLIAVPTTSGTGSEANGTAVLSLPDGKTKKSFSGEGSWAKTAFLDPRYTRSLPYRATVSCALDAFSHALESYLSPKSNDVSRMLALYAARGIWGVLREMPAEFSDNARVTLQCAACAAGLAISITGTGFPHPLGYPLTMLDGIPHGAACAVFSGDYIIYNRRTDEGKRLTDELCAAISVSPETLAEALPRLSGVELSLTAGETAERVALAQNAKNYRNSPYVLNSGEMYDIYRKHFIK